MKRIGRKGLSNENDSVTVAIKWNSEAVLTL